MFAYEIARGAYIHSYDVRSEVRRSVGERGAGGDGCACVG